MRKTLSRFTSSFAALLTEQNTIIDVEGRVENIRVAMLDELSVLESNPCIEISRTWTHIAQAPDIQALWYLRSEMLRLLGEFHGEQGARVHMDRITQMFQGVVPDSFMLLVESGGGPRRIRR